MTERRAWPSAVGAGVAGVAYGAVTLIGASLTLDTGAGLLRAAAFLMAVSATAAAAGIWVHAGRAPSPSAVRGRWTALVVAFAAAALYAEAWLFLPVLRTSLWGRLLAVVLLIAEPAYALAALATALAKADAALRGGTAAKGIAAGASPVPPPTAVLLGAGLGMLVSASWLVPAAPLGSSMLGAAVLVAFAGVYDNRKRLELRVDLQDRVAIVTGVGGRGQVGFAVAETLITRGARVVVADLSTVVESLADELRAHGDVVGVSADLSRPEGARRVLETTLERYGRVDALVNVAGGLGLVAPVAETELDGWAREIERNATTAYVMTRAALPALRETGGSVVNFASKAAERAVGGLGAYAAAKAAVVAFTRTVALEEKDHGVRVNAIAPGMVDTEENRRGTESPESVAWVTREQVAEVVAFLAGDGATGVTGQVIGVPARGYS
ncbi:MAG: SDR family oxidoreductase [Gemmatimonadota bacterium]